MAKIEEIAGQFVEMAHSIVWCNVATVDKQGRPRSRVLHPIWNWNGSELNGWIMTGPTPIKRAHLEASPFVSCNYWSPAQDTCLAECEATWAFDDETCTEIWNTFKNADAPVGYDPAIIPGWDSPSSDSFAVLKLKPWRLRVMPAAAMTTGAGTLVWQQPT